MNAPGQAEREHLAQQGMRSTLVGIGANCVLAAIKGTAGILGNSYALMADAIESSLDIVSSLIVWFGLKVSTKPPDADHPYGHGKAEPLAAIAVFVTLFAAAVGIAIESVREIRTPHHAPAAFTLAVLVLVILVKETLFRYAFKVGDTTSSTAVKSDAWHHRSDAITSVAAFIGISIALVGGEGYESADDWAALFASWVICFNAFNLLRPALAELTDAAPDPRLALQVREIAQSVAGVIGTHKCHVRKMGFDCYVDLDVILEGTMTVKEGHAVAHQVQDAIRNANPIFSHVLIHIEPPRTPAEPRAEAVEKPALASSSISSRRSGSGGRIQGIPAMTTHERFKRMYAHQEADRIPVLDSPWSTTLERWRREGLPADVEWVDYFDLDRVARIGADNSPRYPETIVEETAEYCIRTSKWGATQKNWKHRTSTPEFCGFTIVDPESWRRAKARMTPDRERVDWARLAREYPRWREQGYWIEAGLWFGFDVTHSWAVGTERLLVAMLEDPEWVVDMFNHYLDVHLALFDKVWEAGYRFDAVNWPDDMGYKGKQFFSLQTYRELLKPVHKRACDWAHAKGAKVRLHSCGDVNPFVPDLLEIGIDALNPLEVKAGMNPLDLKARFGERLVLHGGINAVLWDERAAIEAELRRVIPGLKRNGGYIFASDHSIPSSVSLEDFRQIIALVKELGRYD